MNSKHRGVFEDPKHPGVWWIHYYDGAGKRHRQKIGHRQAAIDAYIERKMQIRGGTFSAPAPREQLSFSKLMEQTLAHKKTRLAPLSYAMDKSRSTVLEEMFGQFKARAVTSPLIELNFQRFLGKRISGSTVNRYRSLLSSIFSYGVRMGLVQLNPVARVQRYRENEGRIRFLDQDEEASLRAAVRKADPDREPLIDLALHTGMRRGEQFGLKWEEINLERNILTVRGKSGRRHIPISSIARAAIEKLHPLSNGSAYVCPDAKRDGQRDWTRWFEECVAIAGLDNFTWHDLRHTFASRLVMSGVDLSTVQRLLGHKSIVMTQRYAHLSPEHLHAAVEKLSTAIKQPSRAQKPKRRAGQLF